MARFNQQVNAYNSQARQQVQAERAYNSSVQAYEQNASDS